MGELLYLADVATLRLDGTVCTGCGMCLSVCPHAVFVLAGGKARIAVRDACMECGACARNCPVAAIFVQSGVGCAQAVLNAAFGRIGPGCCTLTGTEDGAASRPESGSATSCC